MSIQVEVIDNNVELALKKLKRKIKKSNILVELFEKQHFTKPSAKRRLKKLKSIARERYRQKELQSHMNAR